MFQDSGQQYLCCVCYLQGLTHCRAISQSRIGLYYYLHISLGIYLIQNKYYNYQIKIFNSCIVLIATKDSNLRFSP